jgi:glucose/arabinose dehydrogenase
MATKGTLALLLPPLLALNGCGGGDEAPADLDPDPTTVAVVNAFPNLSFTNPLYFTFAPGDAEHVFVVTQRGEIFCFVNNPAVTAPIKYLDIDDRVSDAGGEMGLLGLTFDPDYATNGFFYVNYNPNFDDSGSHPRRTNISRFKVTSNPEVADPSSETVLLSFAQPFPNHKGGWLDFGPDGKLYIATGDGGGAGDPENRAQNLGSPLGKILRINKDGTIPGDNPFAGAGMRPEIWAYGLRNPFRASFDGDNLWVGDVGQNAWEEVDLVRRGENYGWRKFEGSHVFNPDDPDPGNAVPPVIEYAHDNGRCTVIGGYVYRGASLGTGFFTDYFYADYCSGELWSSHFQESGSVIRALGTIPGNPTSFGLDPAGELYVTSFDGNIYKIVPGDN